MSDVLSPEAAETIATVHSAGTRPRHQKAVQLLDFAVKLNRDFAQRISENPKITLSAAVVAFSRLDPAVQLDMIREAREQHLQNVGE